MGDFTPGPWFAGPSDSPHRTLVGSNEFAAAESKNGGIYIAVAQGPDNKANARLIAAAPALYEAVEALVECFIKRGPFDEPLGSSEQAPSINAGIAALKQARGEKDVG